MLTSQAPCWKVLREPVAAVVVEFVVVLVPAGSGEVVRRGFSPIPHRKWGWSPRLSWRLRRRGEGWQTPRECEPKTHKQIFFVIVLGQKLQTINGSGGQNFQIDLTNYHAGQYLAKVKLDNKIETIRLVKN